MSYFNPANSAEASDRLANLVAFGVAGAALIQSINVFSALASPDMSAALETLQLIGAIAMIAVFLPLLIWFKRHRAAPPVSPWKAEGFLGSVFRRAGLTAFTLTFLACIIMSVMDTLLLSQISAETMLDILITTLLALFALCFFIFSSGPMDESEDVDA